MGRDPCSLVIPILDMTKAPNNLLFTKIPVKDLSRHFLSAGKFLARWGLESGSGVIYLVMLVNVFSYLFVFDWSPIPSWLNIMIGYQHPVPRTSCKLIDKWSRQARIHFRATSKKNRINRTRYALIEAHSWIGTTTGHRRVSLSTFVAVKWFIFIFFYRWPSGTGQRDSLTAP